jgi:hypothetical protein
MSAVVDLTRPVRIVRAAADPNRLIALRTVGTEYPGTPLGMAYRNAPAGRWTIIVGATVRHTRRRRSAIRVLARLATHVLIGQAIARSGLASRRQSWGDAYASTTGRTGGLS